MIASGHREQARAVICLRLLLLAAGLSGGTLLVHSLTGPAARRLLTGSATTLPDLVTGGCALTLAACWLWAVVAAGAVALDAVRTAHGRTSCASARVRSPRLVHVVVLTVLGLGYGAAPVLADPAGDAVPPPDRLAAIERLLPIGTGLPLPDRRLGPAGDHAPADSPARQAVHRVGPGDSLWSIARGLLGPTAGAAEVDAAWRRLAATNRDVVGDDPDLIRPGQTLRVPLDLSTRKDHP